MKNILLLCASLLILSGCASFKEFNATEYSMLNSITTNAELLQDKCNDPLYVRHQATLLFVITTELKNYSSHLANNSNISIPSSKLFSVVRDFKEKTSGEEFSVKYCEMKTAIITDISSKIQKIAGNKGGQ